MNRQTNGATRLYGSGDRAIEYNESACEAHMLLGVDAEAKPASAKVSARKSVSQLARASPKGQNFSLELTDSGSGRTVEILEPASQGSRTHCHPVGGGTSLVDGAWTNHRSILPWLED